jgi:sugar O-acyltransferase (sialic acid O-acetyltransferase NeuD family)
MIRSRLDSNSDALIVVLGAGGHGKVVADALSLAMPGKPDGFVDWNPAFLGSRVINYPVLGDQDWLWAEALARPVAIALGIGNEVTRQHLMEKCVAHGIRILTVVHPTASVAASATIGAGSVVLAHAALNAASRIGKGSIVNTAAIVEHDVEIGDFSHLAPNAATGGGVRIGSSCLIGLGAQILPRIVVGDRTVVGAGAVVLHDLPADVVAAGTPARIIRIRNDAAQDADHSLVPLPVPRPTGDDRIYLSPPHMSGQEQVFVLDAIATNWVAPVGPHVDLFESEFARKIGIKHALAVSSGTAAMHLATRHLDLEPGDEVFCSTATFAASVNPVLYERGTPVFIDSDPATWNIDCNLLEEELDRCARRGKVPRAVIAVDLYGQCADWGALNKICDFYEVRLIEDAAESLGATYSGKPAGSFGWANIFSFNGNKIITTSGGGILGTNDSALAAAARRLATQARDPAVHYEHSTVGYNYRLSNLLAGVGRAQLCALDKRVAARRSTFEFYRAVLGDEPGISFMPEAPYGHCSRWLTCVLGEDARSLVDCLSRTLLGDASAEVGRRDLCKRRGQMLCDFVDPRSTLWRSCLQDVRHDVYHLPEYVQLCSGLYSGGMPRAFIARDEAGLFVVPLILRPIENWVSDTGLYDAIGPYGYASPIVAFRSRRLADWNCQNRFLERAIECLMQCLLKEHVVSVFCRLHPMLAFPLQALQHFGTVVEHGPTVYCDLACSTEELWYQTRGTVRRRIKRVTAAEFVAEEDYDWSSLTDFEEAYRDTMHRVGAADWYFFDHDHFIGLRDNLHANMHLLVVRFGEQVACAGLLSETCGIVQFHLAGTRSGFEDSDAIKLLTHFARLGESTRQRCLPSRWRRRCGERFPLLLQVGILEGPQCFSDMAADY